MAEGDLPKLGGRTKDIIRAQRARMEQKLPQAASRSRDIAKPLSRLSAVEKTISRLGKRSVAKAIGLRLGSHLVPAAAIAMTAYEVYQAGKEGVSAFRAYKDLERTREYLEKKYGNVQKAKATRLAMTKRNQ
jgi:hypothetical protein